MRLSGTFATGLAAGIICLGAISSAPAQELGKITGTFVLEGKVPELEPRVKAGESVKDGAICAANPVPNLSLVVDPKTKGIKNVFIWIDDFDPDNIPEKLAKPKNPTVVVDQKGCMFKPHAIVARTGQTLVMLNGDPVAHNIHISAIRGDSINYLVAANDRKGVKEELTEGDILPVPVKCDIHPWMRANFLVLEHPYATTSSTDGKFTISGIPPGEYELKIWHESGGYLRDLDVEEIEIKAGETVDLGKLAVDVKNLDL